jgi:hypothetical protein
MTGTPKMPSNTGPIRAAAAKEDAAIVADDAENVVAFVVESADTRLGVYERWVLDHHVTDEHMSYAAQHEVAGSAPDRRAGDAAELMTLTAYDAASVTVALGALVEHAADYVETYKAEALAVIHNGAGAIVGIAPALATGPEQPVQISSQVLVWAGVALSAAMELIDAGEWVCGCRRRHGPDRDCPYVNSLRSALRTLESRPGPGATCLI